MCTYIHSNNHILVYRCTLSATKHSYEYPKSKSHGASTSFFFPSDSQKFNKRTLCASGLRYFTLFFLSKALALCLLHQVCIFPFCHTELKRTEKLHYPRRLCNYYSHNGRLVSYARRLMRTQCPLPDLQ